MDKILQGFVIAGMILAIITIPVLLLIIPYKIVERIIPPITKSKLIEDEIKMIIEPLIKYYKIPQKFIVTKCYSSTDKAVINKDIIIYIYQGKIRLVNDFYHSLKDFGCMNFL